MPTYEELKKADYLLNKKNSLNKKKKKIKPLWDSQKNGTYVKKKHGEMKEC